MKTCTACGIEKPTEDFPKDYRYADGRREPRCGDCRKAYQRKHYAENADEKKKRMHRNYEENKSAYHARSAKWKKENPAIVSLQMAKWRSSNSHIVAALTSKRRATRIKATPLWANEKAVEQYYLIANFLSVELGTEFEVDHVVPLQSKLVCGLHAQTNLSIMLKPVNIKKGNRRWPDMP